MWSMWGRTLNHLNNHCTQKGRVEVNEIDILNQLINHGKQSRILDTEARGSNF